MRRKALGKGLAALLPEVPERDGDAKNAINGWAEIEIERIDPNPFQPRRNIEQGKIQELARSLAHNGVMQPLLVRRIGSRYQIIAGERRWKAAQIAGLAKVPALIREVEEERLLELALIENIQREDLNPMEEAAAYRRLISDLSLSQEQVAERVSKDRSTVANLIRLLRLPEPIQEAIAQQKLSPGHARPLLSISDTKTQVQIAQEIVAQGLSVREVERRVKAHTQTAAKKPEKPAARSDPNTRAAEDRLREVLGTRVRVIRKGRSGTVEVSYYSEEELQRIFEILLRGARAEVPLVS